HVRHRPSALSTINARCDSKIAGTVTLDRSIRFCTEPADEPTSALVRQSMWFVVRCRLGYPFRYQRLTNHTAPPGRRLPRPPTGVAADVDLIGGFLGEASPGGKLQEISSDPGRLAIVG